MVLAKQRSLALIACISVLASPAAAELNESAGRLWGFYYGALVMKSECGRTYPKRKQQFDKQIDAWLLRNKPIVDQAMTVFDKHLRGLAKSQDEYLAGHTALQRALEAIEAQAQSQVAAKIHQYPNEFCAQTIARLNNAQAELAVLFETDLHTLGIATQ